MLTLFRALCVRHPGRFQPGQLRTLQRRVRDWRVQYGPNREGVLRAGGGPGPEVAFDFTDDFRTKSAIEQALLLRGDRDFDDEPSYLRFVRAVVDEERNRPAAARLAEERGLPATVADGALFEAEAKARRQHRIARHRDGERRVRRHVDGVLVHPFLYVPYPEFDEERFAKFVVQPGVGVDVNVWRGFTLRLAADLPILAGGDDVVLRPKDSDRYNFCQLA